MIPLISGMLSSLLMSGVRGLLGGGAGGGGMGVPASMTGMPQGAPPPAAPPVTLGGAGQYMSMFSAGGPVAMADGERVPSIFDYINVTGGGSVGGVKSPSAKGKAGGGGGRLGVNIPVGNGTVHGGASGNLSWYDLNTPWGKFSETTPALSGVDLGYSKDGRDYGVSYSQSPTMSGKEDKRIMLNYSMPFANGGIMDLPPVPPGETPQMGYAMDRGGMIRGPGSGVDDYVQGSIDNRQKVLLSDGEFVVPARVVSALGDGSSEAGAKVLHGMLDRVKEEAAHKLKDNGKINLKKVLPA